MFIRVLLIIDLIVLKHDLEYKDYKYKATELFLVVTIYFIKYIR